MRFHVGRHGPSISGGVFTFLAVAVLWLLWAVYVWLPVMLVRGVVLAVMAVRSGKGVTSGGKAHA